VPFIIFSVELWKYHKDKMPRMPSPTNYLASRENFQICKYRLRRTEDELLKAFEVKTIADLESAMLRERSKVRPKFSQLMTLYLQQHQELGSADEIFESAKTIQRQHIAQLENNATANEK
jgi:hypothetical protein